MASKKVFFFSFFKSETLVQSIKKKTKLKTLKIFWEKKVA